MISLLLLTLIRFVCSSVCREECDNAFIWYTYDVCWTKYYYGEIDASPINADCIDECNSKTIQCMENQQCFDAEQTWCDSWPCDCSWQCDYFNHCANDIINNEDIDCAFQETCYAACPQQDDGYECIEENCMEELEVCFYDESCLNAVENFDAECEENHGGDIETCLDNADQETINKSCEDLADGSEDEFCLEAFGSLGECVLENECHRKNMIQKKQSLGLKRYGQKKKSLKQKNSARKKRLKIERERKLKRKSKTQKLGRKQFEHRRRAKKQRKRRKAGKV